MARFAKTGLLTLSIWTAVLIGQGCGGGGGCCQCDNQCQDVSRASECRGLCGPGGGQYEDGKTCNESTHRCE